MIILDFDGTIVDLWPRYWSVFKDILHVDINFNEYKQVKRICKKDSLVAEHFCINLPHDYFKKKINMLESSAYLRLDSLLISSKHLSHLLANGACILSKRNNEDSFRKQLKYLGITGQVFAINNMKKKTWIESHFTSNETITIIGDSLEELEASTLPNVGAWMVGYGLLRKEDFDKAKRPYVYIDTPSELEELLLNFLHKMQFSVTCQAKRG